MHDYNKCQTLRKINNNTVSILQKEKLLSSFGLIKHKIFTMKDPLFMLMYLEETNLLKKPRLHLNQSYIELNIIYST